VSYEYLMVTNVICLTPDINIIIITLVYRFNGSAETSIVATTWAWWNCLHCQTRPVL